jgi:meso-butanediol dehydrogenase/(S,S)-butanediol dehydrogenase/diacetyl reductase
MTGRLHGKVALITGTGGGQGRAAALRFISEGARVVGCDLNPAGSEETVRMAKEAGEEMAAMAPVDLGDPDQARAWVDDAAAVHGRIDVLFNNAGGGRHGPLEDITIDDWRFTMRNEVDLVFFVTKFAWPYLKESGGVVISTGSVAGHVGLQHLVPHCTGKGAVVAMSRAFAAEGAAHGVRAMSISPGPIDSPVTARIMQDAERARAWAATTPLNRVGRVEEVAALAAFLASDEAAYMTGCDIAIDGGKGGTRVQPPHVPMPT